MAVTVPSDRRFRRSQIPAARRRHLRARPWWRVRAGRRCSCGAARGRRSTGPSPRPSTCRGCACSTSACTATSACTPARSLALLDGLNGREPAGGRPRPLARAAVRLAVGGRRDAAAPAAGHDRRRAARARSRWASRALGDGPVPGRRGGHGHRRVRAALRGLRPADHRRARRDAACRCRRSIDRPRGQLVSPADGGAPHAARAREAGVADRRESTCTTCT